MTLTTRAFIGRAFALLFVAIVILYVILPNLIVVVLSFHKAQYFSFPPEEYSLRWYGEAIFRPEWRDAFFLSLWLAFLAALCSSTIGMLAGLALYRYNIPGKRVISAVFLSPLIMPGILTGLAALFFMTQVGLGGTFTALLLGHILVTFPYVLRLILAALPGVSRSMEEAALTLGADELTTLWLVTLPAIRSAVLSGALFAFILSFDNVMMSLFLSNARVVTLPVKILHVMEWSSDPTIAAMSTIFIGISLLLMVTIDRTVGLKFGDALGNQR